MDYPRSLRLPFRNLHLLRLGLRSRRLRSRIAGGFDVECSGYILHGRFSASKLVMGLFTSDKKKSFFPGRKEIVRKKKYTPAYKDLVDQ